MKIHTIEAELSGEVTCSCGWVSGHYSLAGDAVKAFTLHANGFTEDEITSFWQALNILDAAEVRSVGEVVTMKINPLLEYHEGNESWFYLGPLAEGITLARQTDDRINVDENRLTGYWFVESGTAFGTGQTTEIAWRYYLGAEFGPDDDEFDEASLWAAIVAAGSSV